MKDKSFTFLLSTFDYNDKAILLQTGSPTLFNGKENSYLCKIDMSHSSPPFKVAASMGAATKHRLQTLDEFIAQATAACSKLVSCEETSSGDISAIPRALTPPACSPQATRNASMAEAPKTEIMKCALKNTYNSGKSSSYSCEDDHGWIVVGDISS